MCIELVVLRTSSKSSATTPIWDHVPPGAGEVVLLWRLLVFVKYHYIAMPSIDFILSLDDRMLALYSRSILEFFRRKFAESLQTTNCTSRSCGINFHYKLLATLFHRMENIISCLF